MSLDDIIYGLRETLLRSDVRSYPSRSLRSGVDAKHLEPFKYILAELLGTKEKLKIVPLRDAITNMDAKMNGQVKTL